MEGENIFKYNAGYQGNGISKDAIVKPIQKEYSFKINDNLPDIGQIMKVRVTPTIKEQKLEKLSEETGLYNIILIAELKIQIEYTDDQETRQMHTITEEYSIADYITSFVQEPAREYATSKLLVEDVYLEFFDKRFFYTSIMLLLVGEIS